MSETANPTTTNLAHFTALSLNSWVRAAPTPAMLLEVGAVITSLAGRQEACVYMLYATSFTNLYSYNTVSNVKQTLATASLNTVFRGVTSAPYNSPPTFPSCSNSPSGTTTQSNSGTAISSGTNQPTATTSPTSTYTSSRTPPGTVSSTWTASQTGTSQETPSNSRTPSNTPSQSPTPSMTPSNTGTLTQTKTSLPCTVCVDSMGTALGTSAASPAASCGVVHLCGLPNGVYWLSPAGAPYQVQCDDGWALALKVDGHQNTFAYASTYWTDSVLLNPNVTSIAVVDEAKLQPFLDTPGDAIMFVMRAYGQYGAPVTLQLGYFSSLRALFGSSDGNNGFAFRESTTSLSSWIAGAPGGAPNQQGCLKQGVNSEISNWWGSTFSYRIGIIMNGEDDCDSPDTSFGVGGRVPGLHFTAGTYQGNNDWDGGGSCGIWGISCPGFITTTTAGVFSVYVGSQNKPGVPRCTPSASATAQTSNTPTISRNASSSKSSSPALTATATATRPTLCTLCPAGLGLSEAMPSSCSDLFACGAADGVYWLAPLGVPYQAQCSSGWTLAMKVNGSQPTFAYSSPYWTDTTLLNANATNEMNVNEAKLQPFLDLQGDSIQLVMSAGGKQGAPLIVQPGSFTSLRALFTSQDYIATYTKLESWYAVVPGGATHQQYCNLQGINLQLITKWSGLDTTLSPADAIWSMRVGLVMNDELDCGYVDSGIGIGMSNIFEGAYLWEYTAGSYVGPSCSDAGGCNKIVGSDYANSAPGTVLVYVGSSVVKNPCVASVSPASTISPASTPSKSHLVTRTLSATKSGAAASKTNTPAATLATQSPLPSPVYTFSGDQNADLSTYTIVGLNLDYSPTVSFQTDRCGNSGGALFTPPNVYMYSGAVPYLPIGNAARTVSAWIYNTAGYNYVPGAEFFSYGACDDNQIWSLWALPELNFNNYGAEVNAMGISGANLPIHTWVHVAVTWDGTLLTLYVHGAPIVSSSIGWSELNTAFSPVHHSKSCNSGETWQGAVDDLRIYNISMSSRQIATLAAASCLTPASQSPSMSSVPSVSMSPTAPASVTAALSRGVSNTVTLSPAGTPVSTRSSTATSEKSSSITLTPTATPTATLTGFNRASVTVVRVGKKGYSEPLQAGFAMPVYVDEYSTSPGQVSPINSIFVSGVNNCTLAPTFYSTSDENYVINWRWSQEGIPTLSSDNSFLVFPCYLSQQYVPLQTTMLRVAAIVYANKTVNTATTVAYSAKSSPTEGAKYPTTMRTIVANNSNLIWGFQGYDLSQSAVNNGTALFVTNISYAQTGPLASTVLCNYNNRIGCIGYPSQDWNGALGIYAGTLFYTFYQKSYTDKTPAVPGPGLYQVTKLWPYKKLTIAPTPIIKYAASVGQCKL